MEESGAGKERGGVPAKERANAASYVPIPVALVSIEKVERQAWTSSQFLKSAELAVEGSPFDERAQIGLRLFYLIFPFLYTSTSKGNNDPSR